MQKQTKAGFTLIELLVVVLIIGILAAVAVPQYKRAVLKSRLVQGLAVVRTIGSAQEVYYLANGVYADSINKLDVGSFQCPTNFDCVTDANRTFVQNSPFTIGISYRYLHSAESSRLKGKIYCGTLKDHIENNQICATLGQKIESDTSSIYSAYAIN